MIEAQQAIAKGSKSFFLASLFFPEPTRNEVWTLYRWCRHCDDQVDQPKENTSAQAALQELKTQTLLALQGDCQQPIFSEMGLLFRKHQISSQYPLELLKGFARDANGDRYQQISDVESYAYQVAGVVGAMMVPLMGVKNPKALSHAISMGNAMQLTNIARDVAEDFTNGRVYLPEQWLLEHQITKADLLNPSSLGALHQVILKLLDRADELYGDGYRGLKYLPWRAAFAVASAAEIYSRIGTKIRSSQPSCISHRMYVTQVEKIMLLFKGMYRMIRSRYE